MRRPRSFKPIGDGVRGESLLEQPVYLPDPGGVGCQICLEFLPYVIAGLDGPGFQVPVWER